jgi:hypothetical protein
MNKTILFKAKTLVGRELRIGSLIQTGHTAVIVNLGGSSIGAIEVDLDTVMQMTNTRHGGRYVWEGDVYASPATPDVRYIVYYDVAFDAFRIRLSDDKGTHSECMAQFLATYNHYKYVGNIIDLTD